MEFAAEPDMDEATPIDLERAIAALPPGARDIVVLHGIYGYSHEEAADDARLAVGTCKAQLHRARHLMRGRLRRRQRHDDPAIWRPQSAGRIRCSRRPPSCPRTSLRRMTCGPASAARLDEAEEAPARPAFGWPMALAAGLLAARFRRF